MAKDNKRVKIIHKGAPGGFFLLTYIGAAIHFVSTSSGVWGFILALLKAAVWPAYLVNKVFTLLRI